MTEEEQAEAKRRGCIFDEKTSLWVLPSGIKVRSDKLVRMMMNAWPKPERMPWD